MKVSFTLAHPAFDLHFGRYFFGKFLRSTRLKTDDIFRFFHKISHISEFLLKSCGMEWYNDGVHCRAKESIHGGGCYPLFKLLALYSRFLLAKIDSLTGITRITDNESPREYPLECTFGTWSPNSSPKRTESLGVSCAWNNMEVWNENWKAKLCASVGRWSTNIFEFPFHAYLSYSYLMKLIFTIGSLIFVGRQIE